MFKKVLGSRFLMALAVAFAVVVITSAQLVAVHAADPTDAAGVLTAAGDFVATYQMWIVAAGILGVGVLSFRAIFRAIRR